MLARLPNAACAAALILTLGGTAGAAQGLDLNAPKAGPDIEIADATWPTVIFDTGETHNAFSITVDVKTPDGFDQVAFEDMQALLVSACAAVMEDFDRFNRFDVARDAVSHVDVNFVIGEAPLLPFHTAIFLTEESACSQNLLFDRARDLFTTASRHPWRSHVQAAFLLWGFEVSEVEVTRWAQEKAARVTLMRAARVRRSLLDLNRAATCVFSLLMLDRQLELRGAPVDSRELTRLDVRLAQESRRGFLTFSGEMSLSFDIDDGICIEFWEGPLPNDI